MTLIINCSFLRNWEPRYEDTECDQIAYERLVTIVSNEMSSTPAMSRTTFLRILDWKAPRVKGKISKTYDNYVHALRGAFSETNIEKMLDYLLPLPGIGIPVASTLLHFMYPHEIPIFDVRTVQTLQYAGRTGRIPAGRKGYTAFCDTISTIRLECPDLSLRQIDRALFAYHKIHYEPVVLGKGPPRKRCRLPKSLMELLAESP